MQVKIFIPLTDREPSFKQLFPARDVAAVTEFGIEVAKIEAMAKIARGRNLFLFPTMSGPLKNPPKRSPAR